MQHEDITREIIGCAYTVFNALGSGYLESVYEKSMMIELAASGLSAQAQVPIDVMYSGEPVGEYFADIVVENIIVVELKSVQEIARAHEVQLVNYLTASGIDTGLLINFGGASVEVRRKAREL